MAVWPTQLSLNINLASQVVTLLLSDVKEEAMLDRLESDEFKVNDMNYNNQQEYGPTKKWRKTQKDENTHWWSANKKRFKGVQDYGFYGSSTPLSLRENSRTCCISSM